MKIIIGIPTINSSVYISETLKRILKEISFCPKHWDIGVVICVNGFDDNKKTVDMIRNFFEQHQEITGHILTEKNVGKNNAMNKIISFARNLKNVEVVHFFDDDIVLQEKTLLVNIETLIKHENKFQKAALVGSAFIGIRYPFRFFLKRYSFFKAVLKWFIHNIIIQPYLLDSERPKFCEGPSFCCYLKYFPQLPADILGVTDDAFLSNFFVINGKKDYLRNGIISIIKPIKSISFVRMPINFQEWKKQQIRIHAGVERAFTYFEKERDYLETYFSWAYAFNKKSRTPIKIKSFPKKLLYFLYMYLHEKNRKEAMRFIAKNKVPDWSVARSTKK